MAAPAPNTQQEMRRRNLARVLHAVADGGPQSRAAVAARIGLTRTAVSTLVDELLGVGLLVELGPGRSGAVGRPGTALALSDGGPCGIGAEIGVDHLAVCAVDLRGEVRARTAMDAANRDSDPGPVLERLAGLVGEVADEARGLGLRPAGLAVAVPGLVARGTTTVVQAPNLGWTDLDLAPRLAEKALGGGALTGGGSGNGGDSGGVGAGGTAVCSIDNEANLGALAELWLGGHTPPPDDFVHVSAEIGIGAAIVVDGELLRGTRGFAGELGHVPVRPEGRPCACGGIGCLEQYAGEEAVLRAAGLDPRATAAGHPGPGARIDLLATRAEGGDRAVLGALAEAGSALGTALTGAVNLLDPQTVVLGGALARLAPWLLPSLEHELGRRLAGPPPVSVSRLGADGPLLGAAHSVVRAVLDDPLAHRA
ncbi:ROK family protein [Streptomyces pini]|uniref:Sugar kinase of the NBD/HSP70 family, may contain an N-terminal HTH domain n=1 Tax=Streptomyces pini TaxID=1520580 RepID=A0A1I4CL72_9ACTN|nr:ROK family protein [Streptomyces pini]SFK81493.1 Sugar kinase of the NBD/HSP70 family, may contain an N-terminal HTH domain [Streptomyces pini]